MSEPNFVHGLKKLEYTKLDYKEIVVFDESHCEMRFVLLGSTSEFRVRTLYTKELETIEWIKSFSKSDVFLDVGANIGVYSLYASVVHGLKVIAVEPMISNFYLLSMNCEKNPAADILPLPIGLARKTELVTWMPSLAVGDGGNDIHQVSNKSFATGIQLYSLDDLARTGVIPAPNHIKLDVDGVEVEILEGMVETLAASTTLSVMVEVDESDSGKLSSILEIMKNSGFGDPTRRHAPYFDDYYYLPSINYLFKKTENY